MLHYSKSAPKTGLTSFTKAHDPIESEPEANLIEVLIRAWDAITDSNTEIDIQGAMDRVREQGINTASGDSLDTVFEALNWNEFIKTLREYIPSLADQFAAEGKIGFLKSLKLNGVAINNIRDLTPELLAQALPATSVGTVTTSFNLIDQKAVDWAQEHAGNLITAITTEQRGIVNDLVVRSIQGEFTSQELARNVKLVVGLTPKWANAVIKQQEANYIQFVKDGMTRQDASAKALKIAQRYRAKLHTARSKVIARTEIQTAAGQGRMEGWMDAATNGLIQVGWMKRWQTAEDEAVCKICGPLDNQVVPYDSEFSFGGTSFPAHPNCRCDVELVPPDGEQNADYRPVYGDSL